MRRSAATGTHRATPTRKLIRKSTSAKDIRHLSEKVTLERVLGLTTSNTNGLTCNPYSGIIAYPAGCVIVLFNPRKNSQAHILNPEKKTLTALAFSKDGKYLASGESGHNPRVRVWELGDTVTQVAELNGHKFSINCVAFSPNLKYLVSIGDQHDMLVNIWNWRTGDKVACNKIGCKVRSVSFAENGAYFVTVGNRHVKFWYFDTEVGSKSNVPTPIAGRSGILGELRNNCFCDVKCGIGDNATNTYAVTKSGLLCSFNEKRILDRWVELRSTGANSLSVNEKYVFCGCADGIIRVFHPTTMHFISTLPKPHFLGVDVAAGLDASHMIAKDTNVRYPDVVSLALDDDNDKLCCVYNDHSLYVWDVHDVKKVGKACSFLYHSACIWGIETYPLMSESENPCLPSGSFLTCSSDDTVRVWNIDDGRNTATDEDTTANVYECIFYQYFVMPSRTSSGLLSALASLKMSCMETRNIGATLNNTFPNNIYSKELLKIIYTDEDLTNIQDISSIPVSTSSDIKTGIRCLQVSPDGQLLAAGDRSGNLRVYDLQFVDEIMKIEAHEAEILCVEFSDPKSGYRLLTTSSRDRLIHIFDIDKDFTLVQTIDDHASSVTAVRLNYDDGVFQLLSCGADKHIMIHTSQQVEDGRGINFVRENTIAIGKATLYDMDIDPTRKYVTSKYVKKDKLSRHLEQHAFGRYLLQKISHIDAKEWPIKAGKYATTCGQDRNVRIYDIQGVKQTHCYKGSVSDDGTLIKIQLDPSGVYAATSCSDKSVNIYDFEAGECSAVMYGHSELVTGLKFTRDGTRLISVSGDNCIFVWRLTPTLTQAIIMRLQELGKPLPRDLNIKDNALSALRNTFVIPKIGKDDLQDVIEEEEFSELDPTMFEKDANDDLEGQFDYRFSVGQLPAWAQKQITGEKESAEGITGFGVPHASGRWAQRVNEVPVVLTAQERTLSNGTMSSSNITADVTSSIIAESTVTGERTTITDDSVFQKGVPYASHQKSKNHKDENVIYIPSSQEEFDAEITSSSQPTSNKDNVTKETKTKGTLASLAKIKKKIIKKSASDNQLSRKPNIKSNTVESPRSLRRVSYDNSCVRSPTQGRRSNTRKQHFDGNGYSPRLDSADNTARSPSQGRKSITRKQSFDGNVNSPCFDGNVNSPRSRRFTIGSSTDVPRQRRASLPAFSNSKNSNRSLVTANQVKDSPRKPKLVKTTTEGSDGLFEVHYVTAEERLMLEREGSFKEPDKGNKDKRHEESFQVTARASTKSRKISDEVSTRTFSEDGNHFPQKQDGEEKESVESDSLQDDDADDDDLEEEEEELSENENLDAEHAIEEEDENSIQSPLEQHFEYLAGDLVDENKEENEYQVNESPGFETKHKKGQSFLSRCRSSISAKFLSKSQKAGKNSQLTDEQRKRLDSLKRVIDQNQNYGTSPTTRQLNTKEVRRMKRLSAKSEPNLSFGMPPPAGKTARKSASGNRRGPGVAESQLDLRSIKENRVIEDDLQSRDRVRQLRGSSTSSISPTDREKTTSDLISLFNQRSSTPKPKTDVRSASPVNMARNTRTGQRNSPVVSPVSSPTKHRPPMGVWKDDKVGGSLLKPREEHEQKSSSKDLAVKRRPRKSGERPQLRNRPRSLIIPTQTSLDDLISAHLNQAHSDTELDDESKGEQISKRRKFVREEKPARRFLPVSPLNPALETLVESGNSSLIVRDINIDDSLKSTSRKSWVENTVIFAEHKPDDHDVKSEPIPTVKDLGAPVVSKESFCDEKAQPNVVNDTKETVTGLYGASESSGRLSPPVRDTPMQQQGNEIEVERPPVERHEDEISLMSSHSQSEEEDSIAQCQTAIDGLMSSFKEVSSCHEKALANMNAENRAKILGMLSETYKAIIETTSHKKEEIEKDTKFCGNQEVDSHLQQLLAAMKINGERKEKEQTKQVVDILDHYSDALVKLVEVKLNNKH